MEEASLSGCLVQLWAPIADGSLVTRGIPFANLSATRGSGDPLAAFRVGSLSLSFAASDAVSSATGMPCGIPGRVFQSGCAELSPDVELYTSAEYLRRDLARECGVRGTLLMPVFDDSGNSTDSGSSSRQLRMPHRPVAVLEMACTGSGTDWSALISRVETELAANGLRTNPCTQRAEVVAASRAAGPPALPPDTLHLLAALVQRAAAHPVVRFAQAWWLQGVPEALAGSPEPGSPRPCAPYLVTVGAPCPAPTGSALLSFRQMCETTPLLAGQGLAGLALARGVAGWAGAGDAFEVQAYPLRHFAQAAGLFTGTSLRVRLAGPEGEGFGVVEIFSSSSPVSVAEQSSLLGQLQALLADLQRFAEQSGALPHAAPRKRAVPPHVEEEEEEESEGEGEGEGDGGSGGSGGAVPAQKRSITLDDLTACFRFPLKEAAAHLGMCPTTLKRICRTHRVGRWPSRKKWLRELEPALRRDGPAGVARIMVAAGPAGAASAGGEGDATAPSAGFCHGCGTQLRAGGRFCHGCGTKIEN